MQSRLVKYVTSLHDGHSESGREGVLRVSETREESESGRVNREREIHDESTSDVVAWSTSTGRFSKFVHCMVRSRVSYDPDCAFDLWCFQHVKHVNFI